MTSERTHQLRCIGCSTLASDGSVPPDFRCSLCGELFEVEYPSWSSHSAASSPGPLAGTLGGGSGPGPRPRLAGNWQPNPSALRWLWKERRSSTEAIDQSGVWRFRDLLPILDDLQRAVTLREGNTPLYPLLQCGRAIGLPTVYAKHQGMNPTGSFKDTGMTAALSVAAERGYQWVACASTGNTSAAMAAYAARAGMHSLVLIPEGKISWGKLSQSMDYGALTLQLKTDFDGCVRILAEIVREAPVYLLNSVNPYRIEGQKTPAFEIAEQLDWDVPDHLIVPGGNLANSSALGKGFLEMKHLGLTSRVPRISVIQAEGANPLFRSFTLDGPETIEPVVADTRASAIRIGNPASWRKCIRVIRETGGFCEQVSEAEIALAKAEIGREGVGCEPASAVTLAGLKKLAKAGQVQPQESVVLLLTGHTLKDADYTIDFHRGELLRPDELTPVISAEIDAQRRPAQVLEASVKAVLEVLAAAQA